MKATESKHQKPKNIDRWILIAHLFPIEFRFDCVRWFQNVFVSDSIEFFFVEAMRIDDRCRSMSKIKIRRKSNSKRRFFDENFLRWKLFRSKFNEFSHVHRYATKIFQKTFFTSRCYDQKTIERKNIRMKENWNPLNICLSFASVVRCRLNSPQRQTRK